MFPHPHQWLKGWSRRRQDKATPRKQRVLPNLETLEERCVPAVFNVNSNADLLVPPVGVVTLRSAIEAANVTPGNNTINLTIPGTYKITLAGAGEDNNATGDFDIIPNPASPPGSTLLIRNASGGTVIVDGNQLDRVFDINPSNTNNAATKLRVSMEGFTIQNGAVTDATNADGPNATGGGIRDQGNADLALFNMVITHNNATADGGGVVMENTVNSSWTLTIVKSTISDNHAGDAGGGIDTDGLGTVLIESTVITGNTDINQGAGVYIDAIQVGTVFIGASMTMTSTVVSNNQALAAGITASGGGISNAGNGIMTILDSTIANNFSGGMGGGFSDENNVGTLVVANTVFVNNSAISDGGAIQEGGPSTTIRNTLVKNNSSGGSGGGLFANGTTLTVAASTFTGNTAVVGGGGLEIQTTGTGAGGSTVTNATITANNALNNAGANGGGIDASTAFSGTLTLLDDTINANVATNGGGVFWAGTTGSTFAVENTIIAKNFAATAGPDANNPAGTFTDNGGNLIGIAGAGSGNTGFTAATTQTGTIATPLDPLLGALAANGGPPIGNPATPTVLQTEALLPGSPAVDKGVAAAVTTDERGFRRPDGTGSDTGTQDVGAFESNPLTGNAAFVQTLYFDFLKRLGDLGKPNDAGGWVNALNAGALTPQQVANAIARSPEAQGVLVDGLYLKIFGRTSDPSGRAAFVNFLQHGGTVEQVITAMVTSPEYSALTGGTDAGFVQSLYNKLLGRVASPSELNGWLGFLQSGQSRARVATLFLQSAEFRADVVEELYGFTYAPDESVVSLFANLLHRTAAPSAAEINGWVNSGLDIYSIEIAIAGSTEFVALASTGIIV
jgi:Domain of unknown function (DUF4214)